MTTTTTHTTTTAIFGAGVMGEALLSGLIRSGRAAADIIITERNIERGAALAARYGVRLLPNGKAAAHADTLVLVVKPQDMAVLLDEIRDRQRRVRPVARRPP